MTSLSEKFWRFFFLHFLEFSRRDQKPTNLIYFETVSPIILAALWTMCIVWTISVLLCNRALESLRTKDDFNFTNFLINRLMRCSTKGASHCCFRKAVSNNYFHKFLLINFTSTCSNWLNNFSLTHFVLIKGYGKYSLRIESVIPPFVEWFKTAREYSSWIFLVLRAICSTISVLLTFGW